MLIADTGFFFGLADRNDPWHARSVTALRDLREGLITTWPVVTETAYLIGKFLGEAYRQRFLEQAFAETFTIFDMSPRHGARIMDLIRRYANLPMDLADASLVLLAEHLGHGRILSTDMRDFGAYRWKNHAPFENLLVAEHS
ncbi:MAG: PIN domain-containing protein [Sulfurisoma sp.]|nr:PIN domain-containing protein [Sulfurisoma sp.]